MNKELLDILRKISNKDISSKIMDIANYVKEKEDFADSCIEKLESFRKDEEIKKLEDEIRNIKNKSIGEFQGEEKERYENFSEKHYKSCKSNVEIRISGTGLGSIIKCCCLKCGEIEDITDTTTW